MNIDITEIKDSTIFLNELIENLTSAVFIVDDKPCIYSVNDAFQTLFYKDEDQVLRQLCGNAIGCIFHVDEGKDVIDNNRQTQERIEILKILYDMLLHTQTHSYIKLELYLDTLCHYVKERLNHNAPEISCKCDDLTLRLEQAVPFSIIMFEAIQQTLKTIMLHDSEPAITVRQNENEILVKMTGSSGIEIGEDSISALLISLLLEQLQGHIIANKRNKFIFTFPYIEIKS